MAQLALIINLNREATWKRPGLELSRALHSLGVITDKRECVQLSIKINQK
jgi:hypothetical protein